MCRGWPKVVGTLRVPWANVDSRAEGPPGSPSPGQRPGTRDNDAQDRPNGPSVRRIRGELLVRWTDQAPICCVPDPQGVSLGWENGRPFGANRVGHQTLVFPNLDSHPSPRQGCFSGPPHERGVAQRALILPRSAPTAISSEPVVKEHRIQPAAQPERRTASGGEHPNTRRSDFKIKNRPPASSLTVTGGHCWTSQQWHPRAAIRGLLISTAGGSFFLGFQAPG